MTNPIAPPARPRRRARASLLGGLAFAAIAGLSQGQASAREPAEVAVNVSAPAGKGCISSQKLKVAVQRRSASARDKSAVDVHIDAAESGPGWVANVTVQGRPGLRSVRTTATSCSGLDDGLVLVVTLLAEAEPEAEAEPDEGEGNDEGDEPWVPKPAAPDAEEGQSGTPHVLEKPGPDENAPQPPSGGSEPPAPGDPGNDSDDKPAGEGTEDKEGKDDKPPAQKPSPVKFGLGAGFVYATGLMPVALPGFRASFAWLSPTPVPIEAAFTHYADYLEYYAPLPPTTRRTIRTTGFELAACPLNLDVGYFHFGACGGATITHFLHESRVSDEDGMDGDDNAPTYSSHDRFMVSPMGDLRVDLALFRWLRVGAGFDFQVPLSSPDFADTTWLNSSGNLIQPVILRGRLGISIVLPP